MLTNHDRTQLRVHYLNRFRDQAHADRLPVDQAETKEYKQVYRRISNAEAELRDARHELYELNQAFDTVSHEELVRKAKAEIGIRDHIEALLQEVFDRAQQSTKLMGSQFSYRHELPNAYATVSQWVRSGKFGTSNRGARYNKLFVEYELTSAAARVMSYDDTKKGESLRERAWDKRQAVWKEWCDADQPRIDSFHCTTCDAECDHSELNWLGVCPTCQEKEDD